MSIEKMNFKRWVHKVLPAVYDESLSYYELLCKVVAKLNETIELSNSTAEGLKELQDYVANYFEDLDVQKEINNKLDEMAEQGQLTDIIAQYLQLAGVLAFNTKQDLKNGQNLVDGSICKTLGNNNYMDGQGAFYKIRTVTSSDVVDDNNIIALNISNTLIAEKIPYSSMYEIYQDLQNQITENFEQVVFLGDSYGAYTNSWAKNLARIMKKTLGVNAFNFCTGGAGFLVENNTYLDNLQENENVILDKTKVKKFIICGGYNDRIASNINSFDTPMYNLINYINTNYPNAKIYVGMIGFTNNFNDTSGNLHIREWLNNVTLSGYKDKALKYGAKYLNNVELILHNYSLYDSDGVHPNADGVEELAKGIFSAINGYFTPQTYYSEGIQLGSGTFYLNMYDYNGVVQTFISGNVNLTSYALLENGETLIDCGQYNGTRLRKINYNSKIPIGGTLNIYNSNEKIHFDGFLYVDENGHLILNIIPYVYSNGSYTNQLSFNKQGLISSLWI